MTALLDLSGSRAPRGDAQRAAMEQWVDQQNGTPRIRLTVVDLAGSEAHLVLELKRAADSGDADAIVVGVPVTLDDALLAVIALVRRPILFTLPIAEPSGPAAGRAWCFALAPTPEAVARATVAALPSLATPAVLVSDETLAATRERVALQAELAQRQVTAPVVLRVAPSDRDGFAQRLRSLLVPGAAVFFAGPAGDYLGSPRLVPAADGASGVTLFLSYLTDGSDAARLGDIAALARWPGSARLAGTALATVAASAADALAITASAAGRAGTDPDRLRGAIEATTLAGIATTYRFAPGRHAGADPADLTVLAWSGGRSVIPTARSAPRGAP